MIYVRLQNNGINITGHAHYAEPGKDIVCAGISALVQSLIQSIEELTTDKIQYVMSPGRCTITFDTISKETALLIESFWIGVGLIAETYPDNVSIAKLS